MTASQRSRPASRPSPRPSSSGRRTTAAAPAAGARRTASAGRSAGTQRSRTATARRGTATRSNATRAQRSTTAQRPATTQRGANPGWRPRVHDRRVVSARLAGLLSFLLFFTVLLGAVAIQAQLAAGQQQLDGFDARREEAEDLNRELRADVAAAESPEQIMDAARELGMVDPGPAEALPVGTLSAPTADAAEPAT